MWCSVTLTVFSNCCYLYAVKSTIVELGLSSALMFADMKSQTDTAGHSPFTKRQPYQPTSSTASSMMDAFLQEKTPTPSTSSSQPTPSTSLAQTVSAPKPSGPAVSQQQIPTGPSEPQASSPLPLQQHKLKHQKKRTSITTKASGGQEFHLPDWEVTSALPLVLNNAVDCEVLQLTLTQCNIAENPSEGFFIVNHSHANIPYSCMRVRVILPLQFYSFWFLTLDLFPKNVGIGISTQGDLPQCILISEIFRKMHAVVSNKHLRILNFFFFRYTFEMPDNLYRSDLTVH